MKTLQNFSIEPFLRERMSIFRNFVINFKSKQDCETYLQQSKEFYPSLRNNGIEQMFVGRATEDSIIMFAIFDTDESAKAVINKTSEWREICDFKITDSIVLDGKLEEHYKFN